MLLTGRIVEIREQLLVGDASVDDPFSSSCLPSIRQRQLQRPEVDARVPRV